MILSQRTKKTRDIELWAWFVQNTEGPVPPPEFNDNGCTSSPDFMLGTGEALWPPCRAHDYRYSGEHGDPDLTRAMADEWFYDDIVTCLRYQQRERETGWRILLRPFNALRARYYAHVYTEAVRKLGSRHFTPYVPPDPPDEPIALPRAA